jgi:ERCC4-type nuclease
MDTYGSVLQHGPCADNGSNGLEFLKFQSPGFAQEEECGGGSGLPRGAPMEIVADDRERASGVVERLRGLPGLRIVIRRLDLGDYLLDNRILVERKTLADLAVSIADGRLFSQACRMTRCGFVPALIIEGTTRDSELSGMTREAIQGAIVTLTIFLGIPCLRSTAPGETASLLRFTADQMSRRNTRTVQRHGYRPKGLRKRQLFVLQGLPGIGPTRADRLLDTFGCIEAVFTAGASDLAMVSGIGRTTADAIRSLIAPQPGV